MATLLAERVDPIAAVVLNGGDAFFLESIVDAAALDALADAGWGAATAAVASISVPTIAVIRGRACGPAWEVALARDLRLTLDDAVVGSPEVLCGRMPVGVGTQYLSRIASPAHPFDLLLTGRLLSGREAFDPGVATSSGVGGYAAAVADPRRSRPCSPRRRSR